MSPQRQTLLDIFLLLAYQLVMAGLLAGLIVARDRSLAYFATQEAQANWEQFRQDVSEDKPNRGTVARTIPRSPEPPTLVLLRNHFATCAIGLLGISSVLYGASALLLRGTLTGQTQVDAQRVRRIA